MCPNTARPFEGCLAWLDTPLRAGFGLYFYRAASRRDNARWYDPALGRFAQADSLTHDTGSVLNIHKQRIAITQGVICAHPMPQNFYLKTLPDEIYN